MQFSLMPRFLVLWLFPLGIALASWRFFLGVELTMPFMLHHALDRPISFFAHVGFAPIALAVLPFQLSAKLRRNRPRVHSWLGRVYGVAILIASTGGLAIALTTKEGEFAAWGFGALAVFWFVTTVVAVFAAIQKRIHTHREWILRSAALTFSAVTLRIYLPIGSATVGFEAAYPMIAWLCWVPNLLVAEYLIRYRPQSLVRLFG